MLIEAFNVSYNSFCTLKSSHRAQLALNFVSHWRKEVPRAGRATKYNARITDLLTSIRDPQVKDDTMEKLMEAGDICTHLLF